MLKWEAELESLHRSRMRVVGHKTLVLILQRLGVFDVLGSSTPYYVDGLEVLISSC